MNIEIWQCAVCGDNVAIDIDNIDIDERIECVKCEIDRVLSEHEACEIMKG